MGKNTRNKKESGIQVPKASAAVAKPESGGKGFILAILAIVLVGAGAVAFLAANRDSKVGEQTAAVEVVGDELPAFEQSGVSGSDDPALGLAAVLVAVVIARRRHRRSGERRRRGESRAMTAALEVLVGELRVGAHPLRARQREDRPGRRR